MDENDKIILDYDDSVAIAFIQNYLPQELKDRFSDNDLYYIFDLICEFYEKNDYLDEDDEEKEERELIDFIISEAKKDKIGKYTFDEVLLVLRAEDAYVKTLDHSE